VKREREDIHGDVDYERTDISPKVILIFGVALFVIVLLSYALMYFFFRGLGGGSFIVSPTEKRFVVPKPALDADLGAQLADLRRAETEALSTYAWVDKNRGVARIPIDRAMDLMAQDRQ